MEVAEIEAKIREVLIKLLGVKEAEVKPEAKLYDDLGVDSTELVEINIALGKALGVNITAGEITKFNSIKEIIQILQNKIR